MKKILKWLVCLSLITVTISSVKAQDIRDTSLWVIETIDENEYIGEILYRDETIIRLKTQKIGEINIQMKDVKSIKKVVATQLVEGEYWFENPHATRYFWGPNGYGLRKGEGYYQNTWIFLNQVSVGVTDNFTLGAGIIPLFIFALEGTPTPVWITPKFSMPIQKDKFNIGVGGIVGGIVGGGEDIGAIGIVYGTTTLGSREKNFSFSLGYGFAGNDWADAPTITLSGMARTGKHGYFITENYFISSGGTTVVILSGGGRYVFKKLAIDFGGVLPIVDGGAGIGPWLGVNVPFGNKTYKE